MAMKNRRTHSMAQSSNESALPVMASQLRSRDFAKPDTEAPSQQVAMQSQGQKGFDAANIPVLRTAVPIQTKLTVGQPGDKYEQEADAVAAEVVKQIHSPQPSAPAGTVQREAIPPEEEDKLQQKPIAETIQRAEEMPPEDEELQAKPVAESIQRTDTLDEKDEELAQMKPEIQREALPKEEEDAIQASPDIQREAMPKEEEDLQKKTLIQPKTSEGMTASAPVESEIASARGSGQALSDETRGQMEGAFGADFSGVRVHTDGQSDQLNQSLQARAFTTGQDIFFKRGEYRPNDPGGQELLAHELTHTVQQARGIQKSPQTYERSIQRNVTSLPDRDEQVQFTQTQTYNEFEMEVRRWVAGQVLSRTRGVHREQSLVPRGSLRGFYNMVQPGQPISLNAHFHSNGHSYKKLSFHVSGEEIVVSLDDETSELTSEPSHHSTNLSSQQAIHDIHSGGSNSSGSPLPAEMSGAAAAARTGAVLVEGGAIAAASFGVEGASAVAGAAVIAESIIAPIALILSSFQMMWSVFNIFNEIEGDRAAGMGAVDFAWTIASRIFSEPSASPHQHALQYARSMDKFNGRGDVYRDALRPARQHINRAWRAISPADRIRLRMGFSSVDELAERLLTEAHPHMRLYPGIYANIWHKRWSNGRSFYH